ncbi:3'-5' exonuclease [Psychromonas aquatilis]|uniref:3'-5' exonuclease n=1 Tax=Psychromonas aquatilis TaxID=2005072 RepID=A0ABU9GNZ0_9GAMM
MKAIFNYFHPLNKLKREREKYLAEHKLPDNIKALLSAPLPDLESNVYSLDYLSVDFETSGFSPETDSLLSVGYLPIINQQLLLSKAVETFISSGEKIKAETAIINHIVPEMLEQGKHWSVVMDKFLAAAVGKVIIVHGSVIEKRFLNHYMKKRYNLPPLPLLWVDTLKLEKSLLMYKNNSETQDFRLGSIRERHNLPEYAAHGALVDSLSAGELFLALLKICFEGTDGCVKHMKFDFSRAI